MKVKFLIIFLLMYCFLAKPTDASVNKLSNNAKISLLTCGPGDAVYSKFGHSALWVFDPLTGTDRVYNYGTFDFYSNRFYIEFIRGTALYRLSITNFMGFQAEYVSENRSIVEQELNLTPAEKQTLYEKLEDNYKPENRYYRYDFLFQNCSSLIRDIVWEVTGNRFKIPEESPEDHTYRSMMVPYLEDQPWLMDAIFILLGYGTDEEADPWNQMYLPDYMFDWFDAATNAGGESLVSKTRTLFLPIEKDDSGNFLFQPVIILSLILLLLIALTFFGVRLRKDYRILDSLIFLVTGLTGTLLFYMWMDSLHTVTHKNLNLVWAFPLHFIIAIIIWIKKLYPLIRIYAMVMAPFSILFLCLFWLLPQSIPPTAVLASAIISVLLVKWGYLNKIKDAR